MLRIGSVLLAFLVIASIPIAGASHSVSVIGNSEISDVSVTLKFPFSAELIVSYYVPYDHYTLRSYYVSWNKETVSSYNDIELTDVYLPMNVTVHALFGARITGITLNEASSRFGSISRYSGDFGYVNVTNASVYTGAPLSVGISTAGEFVGVEEPMVVEFKPVVLPSEVLYLKDSLSAVSASATNNETILLPYGDVVTANAEVSRGLNAVPLVNRFYYDATGNVVARGQNNITFNMTTGSSLLVSPKSTWNQSALVFVFASAGYTQMHLAANVSYPYSDVNAQGQSFIVFSVNITQNMTENFDANVSSGQSISVVALNYSNVSIYFPPAGPGSKATYIVYNLLNNTSEVVNNGYFKFSTQKPYLYLILDNVSLVNAPAYSLSGMVRYLVYITGIFVGALSLVLILFLAVGLLTGGESSVKDTYEKMKGLVVVDALFLIVFVSGLVFLIFGGV